MASRTTQILADQMGNPFSLSTFVWNSMVKDRTVLSILVHKDYSVFTPVSITWKPLVRVGRRNVQLFIALSMVMRKVLASTCKTSTATVPIWGNG